MDCLSEHEWFIEPNHGWEEGGSPKDHIKYQILKPDEWREMDAQVICLNEHYNAENLINRFPVPPVWLTWWKTNIPPYKIKYPLVSAIKNSANTEYPNIRYSCYMVPSGSIWNEKWIGDVPKIFVPLSRCNLDVNLYRNLLRSGLSLDVVRSPGRSIPFKAFQDKFIHNRVLLEMSEKNASTCLLEAMSIGMPVISTNRHENPFMLRNGIDSTIIWTEKELFELLQKYLNDYSFAKEMGEKAKRRFEEICNLKEQNKVWNNAFNDAITLYKNASEPFMRDPVMPKSVEIIAPRPRARVQIIWKERAMRTAVIGIGNVGLPFMAVVSKYHPTVGIDKNKEWIEKLRKGIKLEEPFLNLYLQTHPSSFSSDISIVRDQEIIFIVAGSQVDKYGSTQVLKILEEIEPYLNDQIIVIISTMKPGSFRRDILPFMELNGMMEKISGLCYSPMLVALGSTIGYFENPHFLVIGCSNIEVTERLQNFYRRMNRETKFFPTTFENAEVVKYSINLALINKISLLNVLTEYCEKYHADIDFVTDVMKEDPRIAGTKMFKGGLGFGGTCFPLDARAFKESQEETIQDPSFVNAIIRVNERQKERSINLLKNLPGKKIGILGITYKSETSIVKESQALEIARALGEWKEVIVYDPAGTVNAQKVLTAKFADSLPMILREADILFFAVEWSEFKEIKDEDFGDKFVVDPWRMFKGRKIKKYIPYGMRS